MYFTGWTHSWFGSVPKPFLELSILEYTTPAHTDLKQYKYIKALIQEMQLKVTFTVWSSVTEIGDMVKGIFYLIHIANIVNLPFLKQAKNIGENGPCNAKTMP